MTIEATPSLLFASPPEAAPKVAAGRLPLMAFVDAESERVLQESATMFGPRHLIQKGGIDKAIDYLTAQRSPQLLIVDISGLDMPLTQIQTLADVCEPGTDVVAIGDRDSVALYRDLVDAGVRNYIVKPLTRDLVAKLLGPKSLTKPGLKLGKVIAFTGARGGVGTTTMAANLAWHLANCQGRRVALVDLDLQKGDSALLFNAPITPGFWDALSNPLRLDSILLDRIMTQVGERLFVIAAQESLDAKIQFKESAVDALFSVLRSQFHYVIVDVPGVLAPAYRRALDMADRRVIVVDQTMRSMRDAVRVTNLFNDGMPDQRTSFVVNRVGEAGTNALSMQDVEMVLQAKPASLIPFAPKLVAPAASYAEIAASKRGKFGNAVTQLSLEISGGRKRRKWWRVK